MTVALMSYGQEGTLKTSFGINGQLTLDIDDLDELKGFLNAETGEIFFYGNTSDNQGGVYPFDFFIGKMNPDGSLDASFGDNGIFRSDFPGAEVSSIKGAAISDDAIYFIGRGINYSANDSINFFIGKTDFSGNVDLNFGENGYFIHNFLGTYNTPGNIIIDSEERIVFCGSTTDDQSTYVEFPIIGRLNNLGEPDSTFGTTGFVIWDYYNGDIINYMPVADYSERHGEGAYFTELVEIGNNYFACGQFVNTSFAQINMMSFNKDGGLNQDFVNQGPVIFQLDPGNNHWVSDIDFDGEFIYLGLQTDGPFYKNKQLIQKVDTTGVQIETISFEHPNQNSKTNYVDAYENQLYVGGFSKLLSNSQNGYDSDNFIIHRFDNSFTVDTTFGTGGYFESHLNSGDELGATAFEIIGDWGLLGGFYNNIIDSNYTDLVFMGIDLESDLTIDKSKAASISIYPNPSSNNFNIKSANSIEKLIVRSAKGDIIHSTSLSTFDLNLKSENWQSGIYFIELYTAVGVQIFKVSKI